MRPSHRHFTLATCAVGLFRNRADLLPVRPPTLQKEVQMLGTILIILLILFLVGALPTWGHSRNWGYAPSGGLGLVLLIVLILVLTGNI